MDLRTTPHTTTEELLARVPLLAGLSRRELARVSALATRIELPAGRELTHQGGRGREFMLLLEGEAEVVLDGVPIRTLRAGDFVGEIALLRDQPRTATVVATTTVSVDVVGRLEFAALLQDQPSIARQLESAMIEHLAEDDALRH